MSFGWRCPYCNHTCTITNYNISNKTNTFNLKNKYKVALGLDTLVIVCPNPECEEICVKASLFKSQSPNLYSPEPLPEKEWSLLPQSSSKTYSTTIIPEVILNDYEEACLIKDLSPKASATLARRCLQGMIRDFWKVKEKNLFEEIKAIQDKIEPEVWEAIDSIRSLGNIGAHMEKDINIIVDVEPDEAQLLISLLEMLFDEWYIAANERKERLQKIKDLKVIKDDLKKIGS
ncbi:DUF4145 domain-containing protein [Acinetobacter nosocomialis]|uniref:DUF4145 domain-containing protein n=2 Tax=Acinetobacter nosocomialis TaxID=106654 RepID=UPI0012508A65|nr:DUF4145 domain-containing protein [Acinetobacter nosocomialis]